MNPIRRTLLASMLLSVAGLTMPAWGDHRALAYVFTLGNALDGNEVLVFAHRWGEGLVQVDSVDTGGTGSGGGLGNQGGLIASTDQRWLYAVNPGSDTFSVFRVHRRGLRLLGTFDSGGSQPVSLTQHGDLLYVLNAGSDSIAGFQLGRHGEPTPLPDAVRPLSTTGTQPAQISFTPRGDALVVTEKATHRILTFDVGADGRPGDAVVNESAGDTPFGFGFDRFGHLLVTEAAGGAPDASSVSSYAVGEDGRLNVLDASVPTTETAACWLVTSRNGRIAFTTNTGSGTISALKVRHNGDLRLLDEDGIAASTGNGSVPIDLALTDRGRLLYALSAATGEISAFFVAGPHLRPLLGVSGLPASSNGLVAF